MTGQSIWGRPERGSRGRRPEHSRTDIARAAIAIADRDGLAAVTMRAVAQRVGAGAASLYRYVATRDELVALMVDEVNGEFDLSHRADGAWVERMIELAHQARDIYRRHPWMLSALETTPALGPNACAYLEYALAVIAPTGADGRTRLEAVGVFSALVRSLSRSERDQGGARAAASGESGLALQLADLAATRTYPHLADALADPGGAVASPEEQFDRVLRRVLAGLLADG